AFPASAGRPTSRRSRRPHARGRWARRCGSPRRRYSSEVASSSDARLSWSVLSRCFAFQNAAAPATAITTAPSFSAFLPFPPSFFEPSFDGTALAALFAFIAAMRRIIVRVAQPIIALRLLTMLIASSSNLRRGLAPRPDMDRPPERDQPGLLDRL